MVFSCMPWQQQQPGRCLASRYPTCLHGTRTLAVSVSSSPGDAQHARAVTRLQSTGPGGAASDSLEDIIDVLKDAFSSSTTSSSPAAAPASRPRSSAHASAATSPAAPSFATPTNRRSPGSNMRRNADNSSIRDSSSSSSRSREAGVVSRTSGKRSGSAVAGPAGGRAAVAPPAVAAKQRKGPFAGLISSLEQELLEPTPATKRSSSSSSSSSSGSRASAAASHSAAAQSKPSSSGSSSSSDGSTPRRLTRRLNKQPPQQQAEPAHAPDQQQQQQQLHSTQLPPAPWLVQAAADAERGKKQYKPVIKGDLALPGGPSWSALRRHIVAAGSQAGLPTLDSIILVEGDQDQRAVARAVNAPVYVCDGTRVLKEHVKPELAMLQQLGRPLVVLTDPDERGRELRLHLEAAMGPLLHAFVPEPDAAALVDGPVHGIGNRGIEHVVPTGVQQALKGAKMSFPADRQVWSMARLREMRLANAFDDADGVVHGPGGAADRRRQLCALLGLGRCSGAQLLTVLNRFFDEETVEAVFAKLDTA